jgi:exonuclease III
MNKYSKEMDIEICATKIHTPSCATVIVTVYRSPTGDVTYFLSTLETAIDQLYYKTTNIILCGDFNFNYLSDNKKKQTKFLVNQLLPIQYNRLPYKNQ